MQTERQPATRAAPPIPGAVINAVETPARYRTSGRATDALIVFNSAGHILLFNCAAEQMFGYRAADVMGIDIETLVPGWEERLNTRSADGQPSAPAAFSAPGNVIGRRRDGGRFAAEVSIGTANSHGAGIGVLILRNATVRERKEEQPEEELNAQVDRPRAQVDAPSLLLQELRHRMKNNLQVILSMIHIEKTASLGSEAIAELQKIENQIHALNGLDGELLVADENRIVPLAAHIRHLAKGLEVVFGHSSAPVAFRLSLADVNVTAKTAGHLGLLVNEAITNSFKHAVPRGATEVAVALVAEDGDILLTISDNGPGSDFAQKAHVGGTELMMALARQLGAALDRDEQTAGTQYRIRLHAHQR